MDWKSLLLRLAPIIISEVMRILTSADTAKQIAQKVVDEHTSDTQH